MTVIAFSKPTKPQKAKFEYEILETDSGVWKTFTHPNGSRFTDFESYYNLFGLPLVSLTSGIDPATKEKKVAHGFIAVGWKARGVIAIGQFCEGYFACGQFAVGRVAAIGQFTLAPLAIGQIALGVACISQIGLSMLGIHQAGITILGGIGQAIATLV